MPQSAPSLLQPVCPQAYRPLLTPSVVQTMGGHALRTEAQSPPFGCLWVLHEDEDHAQYDLVSMVVGEGEKVLPIHMSVLEAAFAIELCRFGNTVGSNRNNEAKAPTTTHYAKVIYANASKDNVPLHRIFAGAEAGETVSLNDIIPGDLRAAVRRKAKGSSKKSAWETALRHCEHNARRAFVEAKAAGLTITFTVEDYLSNLDGLREAILADTEGGTEC